MKNLKKISLISFLACATLAGGILTANTEVEAPVQEQKFYMVDGAQVRVPDVVEAGQEDRDGLRFIAKMTDAYRVARGELENMSVGMFFLPAEKVDTINEAAVFGENATYYWKGCGYEQGDRLEIVHKETYAFEETKGDDFLTIKCSLWNLLPGTLGREIGAVAYLRVNVGTEEEPVYEYHFAETGAGAKAVSVAQKALLNDKDEIHTVEGGADRVNAAYVNAYLGEGKEVAYTENVYKETASGVYTKVDTVTKSALMTAYNTEAVAGKVDNYTAFDYMNNKQNRVVLFDGTTEVNTYYNYSANRVVLWDDDTYETELTTGNTNCDALTSRVGTGGHINLFNNETDTNAGKDGSVPYPADAQKVIYEGDSASLNVARSNSWDGPAWIYKDLGFTTDTFSFILYTEHDLNNIAIEIYAYGEDFTKYRWINPASFTLQTLDLLGENTNLNEDSDYKTYNAGLYKVTVTFNASIRYLVGWSFRTDTTVETGNYYIDNLCAEKSVYVGKQWGIPEKFNDETAEITFDAPVAKSTTLWAGEENNATASVQYQAYGASEWSDLTAVDGKYSFPVADLSATYMVKVTVSNGEDSDTKTFSIVNDKYTFFNFEWNDSLTNGVYNGYHYEYTADGSCVVTSGGANNGNHALRCYSANDMSWDGWRPQETAVNFSKFGMWITSKNAYSSWTIEWKVGNWQATSFAIQPGTHYYEIDVAQGQLTGDLVVVDFSQKAQDYFLIDNIVLK